MTRSDKAKLILVFLAVAIIALVAVCGSLPSARDVSVRNIRFADPVEYEMNSVDLSMDGWETFTYVNAPDFQEVVFDEEDAFYYELEGDKEEQYSMTASITSPRLDIFDRAYTLTVYYFTKQRDATPNYLTVLTSEDGVKYEENDSIACMTTGSEQEKWREGELKIKKNARYIRFLFTVYYTGTGAEHIANGGLYLRKDFSLSAYASGTLTGSEFSASFEETDFYYNGEEQIPSFTVSANTDLPYYTTYVVKRSGRVTSPINAGDYRLIVSVYDDSNKFIRNFFHAFVIKKQRIDYMESYETVSNLKYSVLLSAVFVDMTGRRIDVREAGCDRIYRTTDGMTIRVNEENFETFSERVNSVADGRAPYLYYIDDKNITTTYNGSIQRISDLLTVFTEYDSGTGEFTLSSQGLDDDDTEYYQNGERLPSAPKDVGEYTYILPFGSAKTEGTLKILPKEITALRYAGTESIDKYYDGTTYLSFDGSIRDTVEEGRIVSDQIAENDDVTVECELLEYARDVGKTYLLAYDIVFTGEDAKNYTAGEGVYVEANAEILPTTLLWKNGEDELLFEEKVYDGQQTMTIANDESDIPTMQGLGKGRVKYGDIAATLMDAQSGEQYVIFTLTNETLFDKYDTDIALEQRVSVVVNPYVLQGTVTDYAGATKTYDGTNDAEPEILRLTIEPVNIPQIGDGFAEAFETGEFIVDYESARYDSVSVGLRTITLTGARLLAYSVEYENIFKNYVFDTMTLNGEITPEQISVLTESLRIYVGQSLPDILTTTTEDDIITTAVYATYEDAANETDRLPNTTRIFEPGDYFVRVGCSVADYELTGNLIIPLAITLAEDRADQFIRVFAFDGEIPDPIVIPVGGKLELLAESCTETGRKTGLPIAVSVTSGSCLAEGSVLRATEEGNSTVVLSCARDSYYNGAENVTLHISAQSIVLTATGTQPYDLYVGETVPSGEDLSSYTIQMNDNVLSGTLVSKGQTLRYNGGEGARYEYGFYADYEFAAREISFAITNELFELDSTAYVPTEDETYVTGKTYYLLERTPVIGEEGEDITEPLYEWATDRFVLTEDIVFVAGKDYFSITATEDEGVTAESGYYIFDETDYIELPEGTKLTAEGTYYERFKRFYGEASVEITLTAGKTEVVVTLGGTYDVPYGKRLDFLPAVVSLEADGFPIPVSYVHEISIIDSFFRIEEGRATSVGRETLFDIGSYVFCGESDMEGEYIYRVNEDEEFTFVVQGRVTFNVVKANVTVYAIGATKYYRSTEGMTQDELKALLRIEGDYVLTDAEEILSGVTVAGAVSDQAGVGTYAIRPSGETETEKYVISYRNGFFAVQPTPVTVFSTSVGHVYGNAPAGLKVDVTINISTGFNESASLAIASMIEKYVEAKVDVTAESDAGSYPITMRYVGKNENFDITFAHSVYRISKANLSEIVFEDQQVLYDGQRHSIAVSYDEEKWQDLEIKYNYDYFVDVGIYQYTATVSKNNYNDLTLQATLIIGTLTVKSSRMGLGSVSILFTEEEYKDGLTVDVIPELKYSEYDSEKDPDLNELLTLAMKNKEFDVLGVYDIAFTENGRTISFGNGLYTVTFSPEEIQYDEKLVLLGYKEDGTFGKFDYSYENGAYTVRTSSLGNLIFAKEKTASVNYTLIWIGVGIVGVLILFILAVVISGSKRGYKEKRRSRRRHQRWA